MAERSHLSIGEVLSLLQEEFPDVTISKIRFLESQGLVDPERTPSGYRKFYDHDVERLRWILLQQRENFLPLKVIKDKLTEQGDDSPTTTRRDVAGRADEAGRSDLAGRADVAGRSDLAGRADEAGRSDVAGRADEAGRSDLAGRADVASRSDLATRSDLADRTAASKKGPQGESPDRASEVGPGADRPRSSQTPSLFADLHRQREEAPDTGSRTAAMPSANGGATESYTVEELARASGAELSLVEELRQYGLIAPERSSGPTQYFDESAVAIARAASEFSRHGVEVRHLRVWRNFADREADLFQQIVMPLLRQRNPRPAWRRSIPSAS